MFEKKEKQKKKKEKKNRTFNPKVRIFFVSSLVVVSFLLFAGIGMASATDYYVATWGSDSNTGTSLDQPWQHPSYAANQVQAGDTIYLVDGTWYGEHIVFANSGTEGNPITMTAYSGTPTLNGVDESGNGIEINNKEHIGITNLKIINYNEGIILNNGNYIQISNNYIDTRLYAIEPDADNTVIENNTVKARDSSAIANSHHKSHTLTYSNNTVLDAGWNGMTYNDVHNSIASGNVVTSTHHNGMQMSTSTSDCTFKNNEVYDINDNGYYITWSESPELTVNNAILEDCIAHDINSRGICFDGVKYSTIRRFEGWNIDGPGIDIIGSGGAYSLDNYVIDSYIPVCGEQSIRGFKSINSNIINTKFDGTIWVENADLTFWNYLDVLVQDEKGNPIHGATVTVPPFDVTVDYYDIPLTVTPINLHVIPREYTDGLLDAKPITETYTGTDGHTPLPLDNDNTLVIADYRIDHHGSPWYKYPRKNTEFNNWAITAEKDGTTATVTGIAPDGSWYREDPNTYPGVGKGTVTITLPTTVETGYISGTVRNTIGETVEGANVTVEGTGQHVQTGLGGTYSIANIPVGTYYVTCTKTGYQEASQPDVVVTEGATTTVDLVVQDNSLPYTSSRNPAKDATGIAKDTNIVVHVKDDGAGVDQSSIVMTIEGNQVTPTITGTPADYTLTYAPPEDFDYEQVVDVTIEARDLASPSNVMPQDSYSFTIELGADTTPPATITDLATGNPSSHSVTLTWTAPGDDEDTGTATEYDIRYFTSEITEANWNSAIQCTDELAPQEAGNTETFTVTGLSPDTTYYFALKTADEIPNWSDISNSASETTTEAVVELASYWKFDEGSGNTAQDSSGNNNEGTVHGASWTEGKLGKALSFDGTNDYVDCGRDSSLKITGAITVEAWVKWTGAGNPYFVTKTGGSGKRSYDLSGNTDGTLEFRVGGADCNSAKSSGTTPIPTGEWIYLVGTYEPSSHVRLFVNGVLAMEETTSIPASQGENGLHWYIGAREGNQGYFDGIIDEVKIHNGALSAEEIRENYEENPTNNPPTAIIDSITPDIAEQEKETVSFTGHGTDTDGTVVAYNWRSDVDGQLSTASSFNKPASELSVGTHTIYFKVQDDKGAWSTEVMEELTINPEPENSPPVADPKGPYTGTEGVPITFDGSTSSDSDGSILAYEWGLGDGSSATGEVPTHTYAQEGTYTVTLTVTDNDGATGTSTTTAAIADTEPTAEFSASPTSGQEPLTVEFTDNSASYDGIDTWEWDFDNNGETDSTEQNPTHVYAEEGVYTVSLTIYESDGDSGTKTKVDYITVIEVNEPPVSNPSGPYTGTEGVAIDYDGSGSYDPDGSIVVYDWEFGDGDTATGVTPTHTFAQEGTYTITLKVTDNEGAINTSTTTATIADTEPTADFSASPTSGRRRLLVDFTDNSASYDGIETWEWDFDNDGEIDSTEQNPTHVYTKGGVYTVSLTVYESDGGSETMTKEDYIEVVKMKLKVKRNP